MSQVLWRGYLQGQTPPAYAPTPRLTDGAPGDTTTHANGLASSDIQQSYGLPLVMVLEALHVFDSPVSLTDFSFVAALSSNGSGATSGAYRLETSPDGVVWTEQAAGVLSTTSFGQIAGSLVGAVGVLQARLTVTHERTTLGAPQLSSDLFDFRLTSLAGGSSGVAVTFSAVATATATVMIAGAAVLALSARAAVRFLPCPARRRPGCGGTWYRRRGH